MAIKLYPLGIKCEHKKTPDSHRRFFICRSYNKALSRTGDHQQQEHKAEQSYSFNNTHSDNHEG